MSELLETQEIAPPRLNRELLVKVVDHAISAGNWNQEDWIMKDTRTACGTAMCVAGFTAVDFCGWKPHFSPNSGCDCSMCSGVTTSEVVKDGEIRGVSGVAREALGLTHDEADELFASSNTAADLLSIVVKIISDRDQDQNQNQNLEVMS